MPAVARGVGVREALTGADRKLLIGAAALLLVLIGWTASMAPPTAGNPSTVPSIYSAGASGARAAYLLLQKLGYEVAVWEESPVGLGAAGPAALLILAEPAEIPSQAEKRALRAFVANGGQVLFCGNRLAEFFAVPEPPGNAEGERGIGKGNVVWWPEAKPLTNAAIGQGNNLERFLKTTRASGINGRLRIYWDEYFHGQRGSLWSFVARTPAAWGIAQAGLLVLLMLFTFGRRSGPIAAPVQVSRSSPLEFVNTLGGLYERAGAAPVAVDVAYRNLRLSLVRKLGLSPTVSDEEAAQAVEARMGWDAKKLASTLGGAESASKARKLAPADALKTVQGLAAYMGQLRALRNSSVVERR